MIAHMRWFALLGVVAVAAVAAAGCGGGDNNNSNSSNNNNGGQRLSKAEYGSRLGAICTDYNKFTNTLDDPGSMNEIKPWIDKVVPRFEDAISNVRELSPPADLQRAHDDFLAVANEETDVLNDIGDAAEANDQKKLLELEQKGTKLDARSDRLAHRLGAEECASG